MEFLPGIPCPSFTCASKRDDYDVAGTQQLPAALCWQAGSSVHSAQQEFEIPSRDLCVKPCLHGL